MGDWRAEIPHCDTVLIRRNVFRHLVGAPGLWLDYLNRNRRITENVFADIEAIHGGIYLEVSHAPNVIDHNIVWDIRGTGRSRSGYGIDVDTGEGCIVAHNLLGHVRDFWGVSANLDQKGRVVDGRVGLCRRHKVLNNLFVRCPQRILFSRTEENRSDGNLFDERDDATSLCIEHPEPQALLNLAAWREYYGYDTHGGQAAIVAEFDPETLQLSLEVSGDIPSPACSCPRSTMAARGRHRGRWSLRLASTPTSFGLVRLRERSRSLALGHLHLQTLAVDPRHISQARQHRLQHVDDGQPVGTMRFALSTMVAVLDPANQDLLVFEVSGHPIHRPRSVGKHLRPHGAIVVVGHIAPQLVADVDLQRASRLAFAAQAAAHMGQLRRPLVGLDQFLGAHREVRASHLRIEFQFLHGGDPGNNRVHRLVQEPLERQPRRKQPRRHRLHNRHPHTTLPRRGGSAPPGARALPCSWAPGSSRNRSAATPVATCGWCGWCSRCGAPGPARAPR